MEKSLLRDVSLRFSAPVHLPRVEKFRLIRRIKILAIDRNVSASSLVQEALLAFLAATGNSNPPPRNQGDLS